MVWDLRGALLKKEEVESARLANFDFRQRARAMRLLAVLVGEDPQVLVTKMAEQGDAATLAGLARRGLHTLDELTALHLRCQIEARVQLIAEIGDPTPHRLG